MSSETSSNLIFTDRTIQQWYPHTYKVALNKLFYTVCIGKLQVTNFLNQI